MLRTFCYVCQRANRWSRTVHGLKERSKTALFKFFACACTGEDGIDGIDEDEVLRAR